MIYGIKTGFSQIMVNAELSNKEEKYTYYNKLKGILVAHELMLHPKITDTTFQWRSYKLTKPTETIREFIAITRAIPAKIWRINGVYLDGNRKIPFYVIGHKITGKIAFTLDMNDKDYIDPIIETIFKDIETKLSKKYGQNFKIINKCREI